MSLKSGDKVSFIDEIGGGLILKIKGEDILLLRDDGFEEWVYRSMVVKRDDSGETEEKVEFSTEKKEEGPDNKDINSPEIHYQAPFGIGDRVSFIDNVGEAVVKKIEGDKALLQMENGFEEWVETSMIIKQSELKVVEVISKDVPTGSSKQETGERKEKHTLEVDLHIHELVEYPNRMTHYEMLQLQIKTAREAIEKARRSFIKRVILIHGVGEGKLRSELREMLNGMEKLSYHDASFLKYGAGATEVELW